MASSGLTPRPIVALDESVVNRIAAGEIIVRPSNAVKELLENCIDAGATNIKITVKDGGVKMLQIQDNGSGIRKDDLRILCERFTTSKIRKFDDLTSLRTYGFRGEALASISHVAHLTVATKTEGSGTGWKAKYLDSQLVPLKVGAPADPQPCAGNNGTVITVEDMFYNVPQRRKALQSAGEEYRKIVDVVTKYAIHNEGVAISCKKAGSANPDVNTSASATTLETIGRLQSEQLKKELIRLKFEDEDLDYKVDGYFSGANFTLKKPTTLIFINHRLVDCSPLRKSLEITYSPILPKGTFAFIYISLEIEPSKVDPNVHPNKKEVHFLNEDEIIEKICENLNKILAGTNSSRSFHIQTLLPQSMTGKPREMPEGDRTETTQSSNKNNKLPPQKMVRSDHQTQTLDAFVRPNNPKEALESNSTSRHSSSARHADLTDSPPEQSLSSSKEPATTVNPVTNTSAKIDESVCVLGSVHQIRSQIKQSKDLALEELIRRHVLVGVVSLHKGYSMVQHETRIYLIRHPAFCEELFYQLGARQFGAYQRIKLSPPPALKHLVRLAVMREPSEDLDKYGRDKAIEKICRTLKSKAPMLDEYFSLKINDEGDVESLPVLISGYVPNLEKLPLFLMRLALQCNWKEEMKCFITFLRELAFFYVPSRTQSEEDDQAIEGQIKEKIFPAMRSYLHPPKSLWEHTRLATSLPELYKVFESSSSTLGASWHMYEFSRFQVLCFSVM
ncbi:hypothetical protein CROQUDRAFT_716413 [Cronartium quercuum f. sp. fusiforme G11]|uniref:DNA mismatch repair protein S5 domain-containing protein n=1 Tax=Cronartium quercuum f. sp. fusiforme G11 TaxID=708437 RepID=A0A9P6TAR4_9BASI|nr:hypothetical protein CROQUDRAFT_716413 [Cronartium quercuum f. sp. fusiforme G11]